MQWLLFIALLGVSLGVNFLLLKFLKTLGTKDQQAQVQVRWSAQTKPTIGGISFFTGFLLSFVAVLLLSGGQEIEVVKWIGLIVGVTLAFLMGLADDAFNTKPMLKFLVQFGCGLVFFFLGLQLETGWGYIPDLLLTLLWTVGLMNSLNMLDNMDGITGSVALVLLFGMGFLTNHDSLALLCIGMAGTVLGFLRFNWKPAKIYMGDSGSQLIGALLAGISLLVAGDLFYVEDISGWKVIVLLVILFFSNINDTTLVTVNRLMGGQSPFVGGRDHSTHNLSYLGLKEWVIGLLFIGWTCLNIYFFQLLTKVGSEVYPYLLSFVYLIAVFISFFLLSRKNRNRGHYSYSK